MDPLTESQIRASFINTSRRESATATLPENLSELRWDRLDFLGWQDRKYLHRAYVVVPVDGEPLGIMLLSGERTSRRKAMCVWCEDILFTEDVVLYTAKRSGPQGRNGNTLGTYIHQEFTCSGNVRRRPTGIEAGDDPEAWIAVRVAGLRQRITQFAERIRDNT